MILYIQTAFLGDLLLSAPTLLKLKKLYPNKKLHLLCRKNLGSLFLNEKIVDVVYDQFQGDKPSLFEAHKIFSKLKFDLVVCSHESFRSQFILKLLSAKYKIAFSSFVNRLSCDHVEERPMNFPEVLRQMSLLKSLDQELAENFIKIQNLQSPFLDIPGWSSMLLDRFKEKSVYKKQAQDKLGTKKPIVCLSPGSVWPTKRWTLDGFSQLAQKLAKHFAVVLIGSSSEKDVSTFIQQRESSVINLVGKTNLIELMEILAGSELLISNDSGSMHMASLVGIKCLSIFGPTVQKFGYQPWNPQARVIENLELSCRPCSIHGTKVCPIGTHECMKSISSEKVYVESLRLLGL